MAKSRFQPRQPGWRVKPVSRACGLSLTQGPALRRALHLLLYPAITDFLIDVEQGTCVYFALIPTNYFVGAAWECELPCRLPTEVQPRVRGRAGGPQQTGSLSPSSKPSLLTVRRPLAVFWGFSFLLLNLFYKYDVHLIKKLWEINEDMECLWKCMNTWEAVQWKCWGWSSLSCSLGKSLDKVGTSVTRTFS